MASEIEFIPCEWACISAMVELYLTENRIVVDSYWETHVLESRHYIMECDGRAAGFFAVHAGATITLFYVLPQYAGRAQQLFERVKKCESVANAMVATGDEFLLSHCVDSFVRLEKQAYFAIYPDTEIYGGRTIGLDLRLADLGADVDMIKLSGDFFNDELEKKRRGLKTADIYTVWYGDAVVGFGVIEYGKVLKNNACIGMFVLEQYRRRGYAANILQELRRIAQSRGCRVLSGCWYYNHNSKKSMESAGAYTKTRLLRFYF